MAIHTDLLQVVDQVNGPSESRNHHPHPQLKFFGERHSLPLTMGLALPSLQADV